MEIVMEAQGMIKGGDAMTQGSDACGAGRDKHWSELVADEKVERMRGEVKRLMREVASQAKTISALREHSHGLKGDLLVPINRSSNSMDDTNYRRNEDWF